MPFTRAILMSAVASLIGTGALAQSTNLQNPGTSTTPGVSQPTTPTGSNAFQSVQTLPVGPALNNGPQSSLPALQFSSINTAPPMVMPKRFGSSNVLSTQSPQATVAQPMPTAGATSTSTLSPGMATFTFTPSQQFQPIVAPKPFMPPSRGH